MSSRRHHTVLGSAAIVTALLLGSTAFGQSEHHMHQHMSATTDHPSAHASEDLRTLVELPDDLRQHMLANMRDHLLALQQIQEALAGEEFDQAAQIAEQRLGMTSLERHGAHAVGPFMPEAMRTTGTAMHRAASQFAVTASDASATGDVRPALADLARVTAQCVACHEGFRVQ
jgi:cytochrome c556